MSDFTRVGAQEVKHKSGYSVFSSGRFFLGYKDTNSTYKAYCEHVIINDGKDDGLCIYTSTLYDENENEISISDERIKIIMNRIALGANVLIKFKIILTDGLGNNVLLPKE
ncbi:hypothetical protein ACP6EW_04125 [Hafnia paralvei]|uniref:hypothetical protein n=1 Tax=Hafnia paralvei TaxID=546367 RepID=UPI003CED8F76